MEDKVKIINNFKKINSLKKYNEYYFKYDNPKISDADYDKLKKEIIQFEKKYKFLKKLNLFKNTIGFAPSNKFEKIKHLSPMLSLSNVFDRKEMEEFLKRLTIF